MSILYNLAVTALAFQQALILLNTHTKFERNRRSVTGRNLCPQIQKRNKIFNFLPFEFSSELKAELHLERPVNKLLLLHFFLKVKRQACA